MLKSVTVSDIGTFILLVSHFENVSESVGMCSVFIVKCSTVPDSVTMSAMLKREQKLRQSPSCQRAIALPLSSRHEINRQIRLRVVREFNLPDAVADLLEVAFCSLILCLQWTLRKT